MAQDTSATIVTITSIEAREKGFAARVRVRSPYGEFHLEVPVQVPPGDTPGQQVHKAFDKVKRDLHEFIEKTLAPAVANADFKP